MECTPGNVLLLLVMFLVVSPAVPQRHSQRKNMTLLHDTVRKFLGVKSEDRTQAGGKAQNLPPRYMMDLYERYRSGQTPMQGNTVRSVLAARDATTGTDMLVFDLTGLKTAELILQSKIYLMQRPKRSKKKDHSSFRLNIGCLPNMTSLRHVDIELKRQKPEWHSYDITESMVSCRLAKNPQGSLMGLTLEVKRSRGRHRFVSFKRVIKKNSQPFVLIFSEDNQNQTSIASNNQNEGYDEIRDLLRLKANAEGVSRSTKQQQRGRRTLELTENYATNYLKLSANYFNVTAPSDLVEILRPAIESVRQELVKSKQSNGLQDPFKSGAVFEQLTANHTDRDTSIDSNHTAPRVLQEQNDAIIRTSGISRHRRNLADSLRYSTNEMESHEIKATVRTDKGAKGRSGTRTHAKRRKGGLHKNRRRKKKKKGRNRKIPFWWNKHDSALHAVDRKDMCRRKSLTVDFAQIGWDDWIISPKSFNAHYCEGSCTFPTMRHIDTSNHAAVQSVVRATQINTTIPSPSCVPSATSDQTILYFDQHGNLVLKSYPNMIVDKCGCR